MEHVDMAMSSSSNDVVAARMPEGHWLVELLHWQAEEVSLLLPICVKLSASGGEDNEAHAQVWRVSNIQTLNSDGPERIPNINILAHSGFTTMSCMSDMPNPSTHLQCCT